MSTSSTTPGGAEESFDAEQFAITTIHSIEFGDAIAGLLEDRVTRLEELVAARWPRSMFLHWRLAREIRASVVTWDPEYIPRGDFRGRRWEWAMHAAQERYDRRAWKPRFGSAGQDAAEGSAGQASDAEQQGAADPGEGFLP